MLPLLRSTALLLALVPAPSGPRPAPPARPITIPLARYAGTRLHTVKVVVAGDTLDFLFDTGGGVTAISPAVAAKLGCTPSGRYVGWRMTGERLDAKLCRGVSLDVGGHRTTTDAVVLDLRPGGPDAPALAGMVSLATFAGRALTLDLAAKRLVLETPASLAARVRSLTPLRARLATGQGGGELGLLVGVPADGGELWLEWDSNNQASTFLAPHAARALGVADGAAQPEVALRLAPGVRALAGVEVKDVVYDGVLSTSFVERARWTVDLAAGRMWMGPVAPLLEAPAAAAAPVPPARDPTGWYDVTLVVRGERQRAVMRVTRAGAALAARLRFLGGDEAFELRDVRATGGRLEFELPMRRTYPVRLDFTEAAGAGTWGDPAAGGGAAEAVKRG